MMDTTLTRIGWCLWLGGGLACLFTFPLILRKYNTRWWFVYLGGLAAVVASLFVMIAAGARP